MLFPALRARPGVRQVDKLNPPVAARTPAHGVSDKPTLRAPRACRQGRGFASRLRHLHWHVIHRRGPI